MHQFLPSKNTPLGSPNSSIFAIKLQGGVSFLISKIPTWASSTPFCFFFNPEVPALGEPTPESPSAGDASGTESPARRRAAHASLRAVGAAAPGVEGLRKGRPRRFRCWKPRLRRMSGVVVVGWKKNHVNWPKMFGGMLWIEFNFVVSSQCFFGW